MDEEERLHDPEPEAPKERSGEYLFRVLKPFGCALVLVMFILFMVFCFTYRHDPAADAADAPAQTEQTAAQQTN